MTRAASDTKPVRGPIRRWLRRTLALALGLCLLTLALFCWNGIVLANDEAVLMGVAPAGEATPAKDAGQRAGARAGHGQGELRVLAFNLAKLFLHRGGLSFDTTAKVRERLAAVAAIIRKQDPDLVFLSETIHECTLCPVDQVEELATATGLWHWAFGENFNFGLPFLRIVGGNAILSRHELEPVQNQSLAGRKPFWITRNNRRALWCATMIDGVRVLVASIHNDSFDLDNNLAQVRQLLTRCADQPSLLAGDFNAEPGDVSIRALQDSGRFSGEIEGSPTYSSRDPRRRIDYILGPNTWIVLEHRVIPNEVSDHSAVFTRFRVKTR